MAARFLGGLPAVPLDGGRLARDGRPWLGPSKTLRGLVAAVLTGGVMAPLLGWSPALGVVLGLLAMLGDMISSFIKRRMGMPSSSMALGLDQIPEALLPALVAAQVLGLSVWDVLAVVASFLVLELFLSGLAYRLRIRKQPY